MYGKAVGPADAKIMLVGEAYGEMEEATGKPFHPEAPAGRTLDKLLYNANLRRQQCLITNVVNERPPANNMQIFYKDKKQTIYDEKIKPHLELLKQDIIRFKPNIVIALGVHALYALAGTKNMKQFHGYVMESTLVRGQKMLATWHPQAVNFDWPIHFQVIMDLRKAVKNSTSRAMPVESRRLHASTSYLEFMQYLDYLLLDHEGPIAVDIETSDESFIDIIGIAESPLSAYSLQISNGLNPRFPAEQEISLWMKLAHVMAEKETVMQNAPFDMGVLWYKYRVLTKKLVADTLIAAHVLWPELPRSLAFLGGLCLNVPPWKHLASTAPTLYNCMDAANTYGIHNFQQAEIDRLHQRHTFEMEMRQVPVATMMQLQGIPIDKDRQKQMTLEIQHALMLLQKNIRQQIGQDINLASPKQLANLLYIDMKLPTQYQRRKSVEEEKKITVDIEALLKLFRLSGNTILEQIITYKKLLKLLGSIDVSAEERAAGKSYTSEFGSVHTCYNITGATTLSKKKGLTVDDEDTYRGFGRWSSSESIILPFGPGNLQNLTTQARKIFWGGKDMMILSADYVQAEAVIVAYLMGDNKLIKLFEDGFGKSKSYRKENMLDVHIYTGAMMYRVPVDEVTKEMRVRGKTIRHAKNYSAGPGVIASRLETTLAEAKKLSKMFDASCPQLGLWHNRIQKELRSTGSLTNLLGRQHKFLDRWGDSLFRSAYSYKPQSTVGDLLNLSLTEIYENAGEWIHLGIQLHDALYVFVEKENLDKVIPTIRQYMLRPLKVDGREFVVDVDFSIGKYWGEMEELDIDWS
jgi:DNA polymerase-1